MAKKFLTNIDMTGNEVQNLKLQSLASDPSTTAPGSVYYNSSTNKPRYRAASTWEDFGGGGSGDMAASTYDSNGDGKVNSADSADAVPWSGVTGKPATFPAATHTHTSAQITDLSTFVYSSIVEYWDTIAGTDANVDTIREVLDLVIANTSAVAGAIRRYNADIGDGSATSIAVTHGLNSLDVTVEVYEKSTGATVGVDVVRTNVNTVTITTAQPLAANSHRVVIKQ